MRCFVHTVLIIIGAIVLAAAPDAATPPTRGYLNALTIPGSDFNYHISPSRVIQYPNLVAEVSLTESLLDNKRALVLIGNDTAKTRFLYITNTTVEVYRNDLQSYRSIWVKSLSLEPECKPWYIRHSSEPDSGIFYVKYKEKCGYSEFHYDVNMEIEDDVYRLLFDREMSVSKGIIIGTKDEIDFEVIVASDGAFVEFQTTQQEHFTRVLSNQIEDCATIQDLHPIDPLNVNHLYFTAVCATSSGQLKQYHVSCLYRDVNLNMMANLVDMGSPVSNDVGDHLAVRNTNALTVYDTKNLENGIPGRHNFSKSIEAINFMIIANQTWLIVQLEASDVFAIAVRQFVSSRGGEGTFQLPNTNIGHCESMCLPVIATQNELIVFTQTPSTDSYSVVTFNMATSTPSEVARIRNIPERPFAAVFIEDTNPPLPGSTTTAQTTTEITIPPAVNPPDTSVLSIATPVGVVLTLLLVVTLPTLTVLFLLRLKNRRQRINTTGPEVIEMERCKSHSEKDHRPTKLSLLNTNFPDEDKPTTPLLSATQSEPTDSPKIQLKLQKTSTPKPRAPPNPYVNIKDIVEPTPPPSTTGAMPNPTPTENVDMAPPTDENTLLESSSQSPHVDVPLVVDPVQEVNNQQIPAQETPAGADGPSNMLTK